MKNIDKFDKEFLNADGCMADVKYWIRGELIAYLREIIPMSIYALVIGTTPLLLDPSVVTAIIAIVFWVVPLAYIIGVSCFLIPHAIRLKNRNFTVTEDTLTGVSDVVNRKGRRFHFQWKFFYFSLLIALLLRNKYHHHYFYFEAHGEYESKYLCPIRTVRGEKAVGYNFIWSQRYRMGDEALMKASHAGEKFYLLTYETGLRKKKTKVAFVYPQKFFAWEDGFDSVEA